MKRYVVELERLYAALLTDARYAYPALRRDFQRDLTRLTQLSHDRGLGFFTLDLPALGKHLDRCLSRGQYTPSRLPASRLVGGGVQIPVLFRGLYLLVFDSNGRLKEDADATAILFLRQLYYGAKKANIECSEQRKLAAVAAFAQADSRMPPATESWTNAETQSLSRDHRGFYANEELREKARVALGNERGTRILRRLDAITSAVALTLGPYRPSEWEHKHGPGAVSDLPKGADRYLFRNWSDRLETVYPLADVAHHDYMAWVDEVKRGAKLTKEPVSQLHAVLKDLTKPRLITAEPSEHMFCQQNIKHYMYTRVAESWIGKFIVFNDQSQNQRLALAGSLDNSVATLDLRAASDSISCSLVGNCFRANIGLLAALAATRTQFCDLTLDPLAEKREVVELHKYSTMGNATTFPVQSLIFLAIALACIDEDEAVNPSTYKGPGQHGGLVSIFGDDIIVPTETAGTVIWLLQALGLEVNTDKSFLDGPFRESCGVDAFRGIDVTPAYWHQPCDGSPQSYCSVVETSNNFYKKFMVTAASAVEKAAGRIRLPYSQVDSGAFGYQTFCAPPIRFPSRWNKALQRVEYRVPCYTCRTSTRTRGQNTSLHQFFIEDIDPLSCNTRWAEGVRGRPRHTLVTRWVPSTQFLAEPTTSLHRAYMAESSD